MKRPGLAEILALDGRRRIPNGSEVVDLVDDGAEGGPDLFSCYRRSGAEMAAMPEHQVRRGGPRQVQPMRLRKRVRVPAGGGEAEMDGCSGRDGNAADVEGPSANLTVENSGG